MKLYIAHPILIRKKVREEEFKIEKEIGIELINPFYDTYERKDIEKIDKGLMTEWDRRLNYKKLVEKDLKAIDNSDGVIAFIEKDVFSIGTYMELWYAQTKQKPIYIITSTCTTHPWLKYVVYKTKGKIFKNTEFFIKYWRKRHG